jgi:hypothetical protein
MSADAIGSLGGSVDDQVSRPDRGGVDAAEDLSDSDRCVRRANSGQNVWL